MAENRLIVTKEDKKVRITVPYADYHYDATFASDAETLAGTETTKAVSPASLKSIVDVEGGLASTEYVDAGLALKANTTDVDDALALKADSADVADALALKADAADVMNALESSGDGNIPIFDGVEGNQLKDSGVKLSDKADVADVALKADITYVDAGLALKADTTDVDNALALKADLTYVEYLMMEGDPA